MAGAHTSWDGSFICSTMIDNQFLYNVRVIMHTILYTVVYTYVLAILIRNYCTVMESDEGHCMMTIIILS